MVKKLFLLRHAQAGESMGKDFDRELTLEGERTARHLGKWLSEKELKLDFIISSPALRARYTTEILSEILSIPSNKIEYDEEIYDASVRILLQKVNGIGDAVDQALLVGHNPAITYLVEYLSGSNFIGMEPAGFVELTLDSSWAEASQGAAKFEYYQSSATLP